MEYIGYILVCFKKYFSIKGCASKKETVTFIIFFGIALFLSAGLLLPGDDGSGFFILTLIVTFLVPPLFSVLVRLAHGTGKSGWLVVSPLFRFFMENSSSTENNIYETENEPVLHVVLVIIWLALSGYILNLGYDSLPDYDYAFKTKVNGKTEKLNSFGIWNDKPVYEIFSTKVTRLGGETIFDGEKYINHVYSWYISPDEKNFAYIQRTAPRNVKTDTEQDSYDYDDRRYNLYVNGELIEENTIIVGFKFSQDSKHYLYTKKDIQGLWDVYLDVYVDGKPSGIFDYEKKRLNDKDYPFDGFQHIEYVDFTGNGKEISALVTLNDKEKILWYGSERIENVYSFIAKSKIGNSLSYTTTDEKDNFYLNVSSPDSHRRYQVFNHVAFWKYTDDLSHIAYAVENNKRNRWTLFIDGKQVDSGRLKEVESDFLGFVMTDGEIDFYGFGMTDDGKNFAYYTFEEADEKDYERRKKILYLNGKKVGIFDNILPVIEKKYNYEDVYEDFSLLYAYGKPRNQTENAIIRTVRNGDYVIVVQERGEEYVITKAGKSKISELFPTDSDFRKYVSKGPFVISGWETKSLELDEQECKTNYAIKEWEIKSVTFEYDGKEYGKINPEKESVWNRAYHPEADTFSFCLSHGGKGFVPRVRRNYVLVDGKAVPGLVFHDKIFYVEDGWLKKK